jgi:hypothetical protein
MGHRVKLPYLTTVMSTKVKDGMLSCNGEVLCTFFQVRSVVMDVRKSVSNLSQYHHQVLQSVAEM